MGLIGSAGVSARTPGAGIMRSGFLNIWNPSRIPNVVEWHDWQTISGTNGDPVASTTGKILGLNFVQAIGASKPTLTDSGINGRRAIRITTDDFITCDALAAYLTGDDVAFTVFSVLQVDNLGAINTIMSVGSSTSATRFHLQRQSATNLTQVQRQGDADGSATTAAGLALPSTPIAMIQKFTGTTVTILHSTSLTALMTAAALNLASVTLDRYTLGCRRTTTTTQFMTGYKGEHALATGVSSTATDQLFMNYAASRWGTP